MSCPGKDTWYTVCVGGLVGPRASLDGRRKSHHYKGSILDRPAHTKSLYQLRYPDPHEVHRIGIFLMHPTEKNGTIKCHLLSVCLLNNMVTCTLTHR